MNLILCIDTAVVGASVCLAQNGVVLGLKKNEVSLESAAWIHTAIQQLCTEQDVPLTRLAAIAVCSGPGSYTGLRVGMATAKGLCYALSCPLLTLDTLQVMAVAARHEPTDLLCPMIDARRMEVFTGIYTKQGATVWPAQAAILQPELFNAVLEANTVTFFGNGSNKFAPILHHANAVFSHVEADASHAAPLAKQAYEAGKFADLAYSEPFYGKAFYSPAST